MATKAEGANIGYVAFASSFDDWHDVVGVPEALATPVPDSPVSKQRLAVCTSRVSEPACRADRIDAAVGADASITQEDLFAEIRGLRAKLPFVHTIPGAEGETATRNFDGAPAAQPPAIGTAGDRFSIDPATPHCARGVHFIVLKRAAAIPCGISANGTKSCNSFADFNHKMAA